MEDQLHAGLVRTHAPSMVDALHGFAAASPDLVCSADLAGRITAANAAWQRVLGWTPIELVGRDLLGLVHVGDRSRARAAMVDLLDGRTVTDVTTRWRCADGAWRWIRWSATLSPSRQLVYASGRDVTDRVEADLRTARKVVDLELALSGLRADCDELRQRDRRKDTYMSAVSHELRTPLMIVQGAAESLTDVRSSVAPGEVAEIAELIVTHAARIDGVLDELLDVDRLTHGRLGTDHQVVELVALVEQAIEESAIASRVDLVGPDEVTVTADRVQLEHIVTNLLENAEKYAPEGPVVVTIDTDTIDTDRDTVRIGVRDQGPGIPPAALQRVFEPFWRLDEHDARPGTGVGLALVAEFARLHGGRAWAEPATRGAHVVVELPVHRSDTASASADAEVEAARRR